jgi:4-hydroxybenzoate polyprenyltransferase
LGLTAMIIEQVINEPLWLSTYTRFVWGWSLTHHAILCEIILFLLLIIIHTAAMETLSLKPKNL